MPVFLFSDVTVSCGNNQPILRYCVIHQNTFLDILGTDANLRNKETSRATKTLLAVFSSGFHVSWQYYAVSIKLIGLEMEEDGYQQELTREICPKRLLLYATVCHCISLSSKIHM